MKIRANQTNPTKEEDKGLWILLSAVSFTHGKEVPLTIEQLNPMWVIGFFAQLGPFVSSTQTIQKREVLVVNG